MVHSSDPIDVSGTGRIRCLSAVLWVFGLYLMPFVGVVLDDVLIGTRWFATYVPWLIPVFEVVYYPMIKLLWVLL